MENERMRLILILDDINQSLDRNELDAVVADLLDNEETAKFATMEEVMEAHAMRSKSFEEAAAVVPVAEENEVTMESVLSEIAELRKQLAARPKKSAGAKVYRLLKDDVSWSTTPQVHATMRILRSIVEVGGTFTEADAVAAMVANEALLDTVQGGKKIFDYYKSKTIGLQAHGNIVQVL